MKRIAIFRTCALGDAVQCTPLLQQIRADSPSARISFFTSANVAALFTDAPFVDEAIALPAKWLSESAGRHGMWRAWRHVAQHGPFDAVVSLEPTWLRNLGSVLVRAPLKAGISFVEGRKPFDLFTHSLRITGDSRCTTTHASLQYLNLWLHMTHGTDRLHGYNMRHLLQSSQEAEHADFACTPRVCIAPGTGNRFARQGTKQWAPASFVELGERLLADGLRAAYLGAADDLDGASVPLGAENWLGATTVREAAQIIHGSDLLVGNDSGLFHLAQGLGTPAIGIFGPTSPQFTGVFRSPQSIAIHANLSCMPCYRDTCDTESDQPKPCCMSAVSVNRILHEVRERLGATSLATHNPQPITHNPGRS